MGRVISTCLVVIVEGRVPAQEDIGDDTDAPHVHRRVVFSAMAFIDLLRVVLCRSSVLFKPGYGACTVATLESRAPCIATSHIMTIYYYGHPSTAPPSPKMGDIAQNYLVGTNHHTRETTNLPYRQSPGPTKNANSTAKQIPAVTWMLTLGYSIKHKMLELI